MASMIDSILSGFHSYKQKVGNGIMYSILLMFVGMLEFIPFIGPIIYSYIYPSVLRKVADTWDLSKGEMNKDIAFKIALLVYGIPGILMWILIVYIIFTLLSSGISSTMSGGLYMYLLHHAVTLWVGILLIGVIQIILSLLFYASFIDTILGKSAKISIRIKDSFLYIVTKIITLLIIYIPLTVFKFIGALISPVVYLAFSIISAIVVILTITIPLLSVFHYAANQ